MLEIRVYMQSKSKSYTYDLNAPVGNVEFSTVVHFRIAGQTALSDDVRDVGDGIHIFEYSPEPSHDLSDHRVTNYRYDTNQPTSAADCIIELNGQTFLILDCHHGSAQRLAALSN